MSEKKAMKGSDAVNVTSDLIGLIRGVTFNAGASGGKDLYGDDGYGVE